MQHGDGPIIAETGLIVAEVHGFGRRLGEVGQIRLDGSVQGCNVVGGRESRGTGELLGYGADAEERSRRERDAAFSIGPAPTVSNDDLAVADYGTCPAGS